MEYIYAAMLLHKSGHKIEEGSVKKVLESAGVKVDESRVKALVAALDGVNIQEAIEKASVPVAQSAPAATETKAEHKVDEKKKAAEESKKAEEAAAGLGALFG